MKKFIIVFLLSFITISTAIPNLDFEEVKASSPQALKWKDFDIRTSNGDLTAKDIDNFLAKKGKSETMKDMGEIVFNASKRSGLNAGVLLGMIANETGWGTSNMAKNFNNYGGVMCMKGRECVYSGDRKWTVFKDKSESVNIQADLLMGKTYVGAGLTTMEKMINRYAPPHENDLFSSNGYIAVVGGVIDGLGFEPTGGKLGKGTGEDYVEKTTGKTTPVGTYDQMNFFITSTLSTSNSTGVNAGNNVMPSEMSYTMRVFSENTAKVLNVIGVIMSAIIVAYMGVVVILYVAVFRGHSFNTELLNKLTKINSSDVYSRQMLFKILGLCVFATIMIGLFLSNTHSYLIAFLYVKISDFINFIA